MPVTHNESFIFVSLYRGGSRSGALDPGMRLGYKYVIFQH